MAAPVASFTIIPLADVDPDSPITSDLFDSIRLNQQHLFAQLVGDPVSSPTFTPAAEHDHDGVNSKSLVGSSMVFLERKLVSGGAITSFDFSATLNGDSDDIYYLVGRAINALGTTESLELRVNGTKANVTPAVVTPIPISGGVGYFDCILWADSAGIRACSGSNLTIDSAQNIVAAGNVKVRIANVVGNITSLGFEGLLASWIDDGSDFTLYRLKQV